MKMKIDDHTKEIVVTDNNKEIFRAADTAQNCLAAAQIFTLEQWRKNK